jgi:hypothetical protein
MNRITITLIISVLLACGAQSLDNKTNTDSIKPTNNSFNDYWYQGKAEINRFELSQARYGELRKGDAIMAFVTEDFLIDKLVKKESNTSEKAAPILKLNYITKFNTGIYDYSMMSSIFTPINGTEPMKITNSSQEWCGHTWLQIDNTEGKHFITGSSYFEKEANQYFEREEQKTEDGLWNLIRMNPNKITEGTFNYIPSTQYLRLMHQEIKAYEVNINKLTYSKKDMPGKSLMTIKLEYPELKRTLEIIYESEFPYQIAGWKETRKSGFGKKAKTLETVAKRTHQIMEPYWSLNGNSDESYRKKLGLK